MTFSIIVHITNRKSKIKYLFESLKKQVYKDFEVILIEQCKGDYCENVYQEYKKELKILYFNKPEAGQGYSINYGLEQASGDFFVILNPDSFLLPDYLAELQKLIERKKIDAFKGTAFLTKPGLLNKAYKFAETEFYELAGKRKYFSTVTNSGFSRKVFSNTAGILINEAGNIEEYFIRLEQKGYHVELSDEIFVLRVQVGIWKGFKEFFLLGSSVINLSYSQYFRFQFSHFLPLLLFAFLVLQISFIIFSQKLFLPALLFLFLLLFSLSLIGFWKKKSLLVGVLSSFLLLIQIAVYSVGMVSEAIRSASR